jgi:EmrB/QacA subfamily drug resistance transporter
MTATASSPPGTDRSTHVRPGLVLAVLCLTTYTILLDGSIVNVTLPTLVRELGATTTDLKWIVDAYNLTFAALVLAAGSLSDRYGRKGALLAGLAIFLVGNAVATQLDSTGSLIAARAVMGIGAALIFPTTLSIITNVFTDRAERAKAIGIWGAMTGLGVASGPILGGWLIEHYWWGSVFALVSFVAFAAMVAVVRIVPTSKDPEAPSLDKLGLLLSTVMLGSLVVAIIEAPEWGWLAAPTLSLFALAAVTLAVFVMVERRREHPMLDVTLFANPRFSAASASVTFAFFALFGFIFLITQYFQFVRGYTPLQSGLRVLPVAFSIAIAAVTGTKLAVRFGNKQVVATGLLFMSIGFAWVSTGSAATPYLEIIGQMIFLGLGLGFTSAPATEAVMGAVPPEKAGQGSAVNDATREVGGTLGIAVLGSVYASIYGAAIASSGAWSALPAQAREMASDGLGLALGMIDQLGLDPTTSAALAADAQQSFLDGLQVACLVAAGVTLLGSIVAAALLPSRPRHRLVTSTAA